MTSKRKAELATLALRKGVSIEEMQEIVDDIADRSKVKVDQVIGVLLGWLEIEQEFGGELCRAALAKFREFIELDVQQASRN